MQLSDSLMGALFLAIGLVMFAMAIQFPAFPGQPYGASLFPSILGLGLALSGLLMVFSGFKSAEGRFAVTIDPTLKTASGLVSAALVVAAVLAHIFLAGLIGFIPVTILTLLALFVWFRVPLVQSIAFAIAGAALCWILFAVALEVPLPRGPIESLF